MSLKKRLEALERAANSNEDEVAIVCTIGLSEEEARKVIDEKLAKLTRGPLLIIDM